MLPVSRVGVEKLVAYRDKQLAEGKCTGFLHYSANMTSFVEKHSSVPAVQVRMNRIGIRGLFASTALPKGFIIPFDGEYFDKDTHPKKSTAEEPFCQLNCNDDEIESGDGKHVFIPYVVSSMNLAQCINHYQDLGEVNCQIMQARDFVTKPYIKLTRDLVKGEEILVDYGQYYPNNLKVPKPKPVKSQYKLAKVVTKGNVVGVARHVCTICNKILLSKKQRTVHNRFKCKKRNCNYKFKIL